MLAKKRHRSATQPITLIEVLAAKFISSKEEKSHDDLDLIDRPFRGRLLSVPTTHVEKREVKNGSAPQKYIRPKTPVPAPTKISPSKTGVAKARGTKKPVSAKVDSGRSVLSRTSTARRSVRSAKTKPDSTDGKTSNLSSTNKGSHSSLVDSKHIEQTRPMRRSASVRVSGSALGNSTSVKAAAERANALVESKKKAKVGDAIRARATAKVDSRRTATDQVRV